MDASRRLFLRLKRASNQHRCYLATALGCHCCALHPDDAVGWLNYGRALSEAARYDEAEQALLQSLSCCPLEKQHTVLAHLGHLHALRGDFGTAETWYRRAFKEAPSGAEERLYLGEILFRSGRLTEAELTFRSVVAEWNESLGEAWYFLGLAVAAQGRIEEALEPFRQAVEIAPDREKYRNAVREMLAILGLSGQRS